MRNIAVVAGLALLLLAGCAGTPPYEHTSTRLADGTTRHVLRTSFRPCQSSRDWAVRTLTQGADELCPSGYTLVDEQTPVTLDPLGEGPPEKILSWEIRCRDAGRPRP
ncbi:hypothetical protein [Nitrosovibrio sp. Nv17]|jgi:hypothetical protein|uniref:hypothetical protein n=1 Tax=Nitrosovibrio sp. Nv17 TaxID=1855339 RepID=UPI0009085A51|nr:hypothetical protein [Nitrosovibrio sp. Nv17]SFW17511.1 hypothetical protein SAMN05216414_10434 [Nitrosovibrio sp. Nv17]